MQALRRSGQTLQDCTAPWSLLLIVILLCSMQFIWHINKNVLAHASLTFPTEDLRTSFMQGWNDLITASTEVEYQQQLSEPHLKFSDEYGSLMGYLQDTWIPHHTKFIAAWTKQWLHLGNTTTSRVEGAHCQE